MASGSIDLTSSKAWAGKIAWSSTVNIGGNYSDVYVKATMRKTDGYLTSSNSYTSGTISIDGKQYNLKGYQEFKDEVIIFEDTIRVTHGGDGTKSITISLTCNGQADTALSGYQLKGNGVAVMDAVPRGSSLTVENGTLGVEMNITIEPKGLDFVHRLTFNVGNTYAGYIAGSDTSYATATRLKWTPQLVFAQTNTTGVNISVKLTLRTYTSAGVYVGSVEKTITCAIPDSVRPSCSLEVNDATGYDRIYGNYVQGLSKIHFRVTSQTSYGSPIQVCEVNTGDSFHLAAEGTTSELLTGGSRTVTATVTDARGRTGSASQSLDVMPYAAPSVTALSVIRCDADGTENGQGKYVRINFSATASSLNNNNSVRYSLKYKPTTQESNYTEVQLPDLNNIYAVNNYAYIFEATDSSSYDVIITAADNHKSATRSTSASTAFTFMDWHPTGTGIAFGKVSEKERTMEIAMHAEVQGTLARMGNQYSYFVPEGNPNAEASGFDLMARITVVSAYANAPMTFTFTRRGAMYPMTVHFSFQNQDTVDPVVGFRTLDGEDYGAYLVKNGASVWDLYVARSSGYDFITLRDWFMPQYLENRVEVTFPGGYQANLTPNGTNVVQITPAMQPTLLDSIHPVNSIYISYSHTDPSLLFGGVWERISNAFLWGAAPGGAIGATGGEATVALSRDQIPYHTHEFEYSTNNGASFTGGAKAGKDGKYVGDNYLGFSNSVTEFASYQVRVAGAGGGEAHNNMPPYVQVSIWRRIA